MALQITSFGKSNLLDRRVAVQNNLGLMNQAPLLNSNQLQMNQMADGFTSAACDWRALASMTLAGTAFKLGKLATMGAVSSTVVGTGVGFLAEVATFRSAEALLHGQSMKGAFELKGFASTALSFGLLKGSGSVFRNQNQILTHTLQSAAMVAGHELGARLKLVEAQSGTLTQKLINAEAMNFQMQAGASLVYATLPGLAIREKALDLAVQSFLPSTSSGQAFTKERSGLRESLPLMSKELSVDPADKVLIPGGKFVMGSKMTGVSFEDETPYVVDVSPFKILRTPFTNARLIGYWAQFYSTPFAIIGRDNNGIWRVVRRGRSEAELQTWIGDQAKGSDVSNEGRAFAQDSLSIYRVIPEEGELQQNFKGFEQPAVNFDWAQSVALADAMGGFLPTEAQWEAAARGPLVNVTERMNMEGVPSNRFEEFVAGPKIERRCASGCFGRYENFVPMDPVTGQMIGTEFFTNPSDARVQRMLREGQAIGAWRVFSTESGAFEEPAIWSSVTIERTSTRPVMEGRPGPFGLREMNGNVWEWGNDAYDPYPPANAGEMLRDPTGPTSGSTRVLRGGAWLDDDPRSLRAAYRDRSNPAVYVDVIGSRAAFPQD